jgi:vitamin B12 transporter
MSFSNKFFIYFFITLFATKIVAQDFVLDQITVSANRVFTPVNETGAIVDVIDEEIIQNKKATFLTQILSTTPGISVSQNGPVGSTTEIKIRGYGSKYIKVYYDGIDIADVTGVEVKPYIVGIPSNNLKKIEILQGSQSALYGSEAVGGVLFLETKDLKEKNDSSINIQYGSYNTKSLSISTGYQIEGTKLGLRFSNTESDGYSALETSKEGAENDGYFNREISIKTLTDFNNGASFTLNLLNTFNKGDYDGFMGDAENYYYEQLNQGLGAKLSIKGKNSDQKFGLNFYKTDRTQFSPFASTEYYGNRGSIDYQILRNFNFGRGIFGLAAETNTVEINKTDKVVNNYASFISLLTKPINNATLDTTIRLDDHSVFGQKITGRITGTYQPNKDLVIKVGSGTGFRAPSLDEMYGQYNVNDPSNFRADSNGDFTVLYGNPLLKPENSTSMDAGFSYRINKFNAVLSGSIFNIKIDNAISWDPEDPTDWYDGKYNQLGSKSERKGYDLRLNTSINSNSKFGISYANTTDENGNSVSNIPKQVINVSLFSKVTDKLSINGELQSVSELTGVKSDGSGVVPLKDYNLLNAKLSYLLNGNSKIYLNGENLLDETYETSSGYGTAKRSFYLGYERQF